ncbi:MAG: YcnI family protein, partial [Egibacteraceae bacterium]
VPALAHVRIEGEGVAGERGTFSFRVPNERDDASTIMLEVQFPEDHPLASVSVQTKPGWTIEVAMRTLDEPIVLPGDEATEVTEVVDTITWSGGIIGPGEFDVFTVRGGPFPEGVEQLVFPALQTYDNGEVVSWIEEDPEAEFPAPVLPLAPAAEEEVSEEPSEAVSEEPSETVSEEPSEEPTEEPTEQPSG